MIRTGYRYTVHECNLQYALYLKLAVCRHTHTHIHDSTAVSLLEHWSAITYGIHCLADFPALALSCSRRRLQQTSRGIKPIQ